MNNMMLSGVANRTDELDGPSFEGAWSLYIHGYEVDVLTITRTMNVACPTVVNIDRHQATGANVVPCYHGGGRMTLDVIEAERSDGEQMGGLAS